MIAFPRLLVRAVLVFFALASSLPAAVDYKKEREDTMAKLTSRAAAGEAAAQYELANDFEWGGGLIEKDEARAIELYTKAAAQGSSKAALNLGLMYADGRGTDANPNLAAKFLKQAAEAGLDEAQYHLGLLYAEDGGLPRNDEEAFKWFRLAAEQGNVSSAYYVGHAYSLGLGVQRDTTVASKWLKLAIENQVGGNQAEQELAELVKAEPKLEDVGSMDLPNRPAVAAAPAPKPVSPAPQPAPPAASPYGTNLPAETLAFIAKAEAGDPKAESQLAYALKWGSGGVTQSKAKAAEWYRKGAERGDTEAQMKLGELYYSGSTDASFPKNIPEALRWFKKASEGGHAGAGMQLGMMYDRDKANVTVDKAEAFRWYMMAAKQGNENGQVSVGVCYIYGTGVPKDIAEGAKWLQKAAAQGNSNAKQQLDQLGVAATNPDAFKDSLAPLARNFETAFNAASDLAGRERAVVKFSREVAAAGSKANAAKEQLTEFVLRTLQPMMERRLDEAGAYVMKLDSQVCDLAVLPRVLPANVLTSVRSYAKRVADDYNAQQDYIDTFRPLLNQAKAGNTLVQLQVAERYLQGAAASYAESFRRQAVYWFRQAQKQGQHQNDARIEQLVEPYRNKFGEAIKAKNGPEAVAACEALGEAGYEGSALEAALYYAAGRDGVAQNQGSARYWFQRATELGLTDARLGSEMFDAKVDEAKQAELAYKYGEAAAEKDKTGVGFETAAPWYRFAAALGSQPAAGRLKEIAELGDLTKLAAAPGAKEFEDGMTAYEAKDYAKAFASFTVAAGKGQGSAMFNLGLMCAEGQGTAPNLLAARMWLTQALAAGNTKAADPLKQVEALIAGGGVEFELGLEASKAKNFAEALAQWQKSAAKGNADALFNLGVMYEEGDGTPRDTAQALVYFEKSAALGNKDAKAAVEEMRASLVGRNELDQGEVARKAKKYTEAVAWFEKSAKLGNVNAMTTLGIFYMDGAGEIFADSDKARFWLKQAVAKGDVTAGEYLKTVELMASLRGGLGSPAQKAPPPKGASLVKGSKWTADEVLAALKRGADHEALAVALRTDGIDYYHGDYVRILLAPEAARVVEHGHLSMALVDGYKPGAGAWATDMAKAAISARRSQLKLAPSPVDSAELRARAKAGDAAALYALFLIPQEQLKLGALPPELSFNYPQFAQLMITKNYAPGLWVAAALLVNQNDKAKNDFVLQAEYLRRSAEAGDARGANEYGKLFFAPGDTSLAPNFAEAEQWFIEAGAREQAGDFSVMPPELALTVLYSSQAPIGFSGTDLRPDDASLRWLRELIRRGGKPAEHAQLVLESWRRASNPRPVDAMLKDLPPEVAAWSAAEVSALQTSAQKGEVAAALKLAAAYESGRGVRQNDARAVELFLIAANKGSVPAMRALAAHYAKGFGVKKIPAERLVWLEKAGAVGDVPAWREVGDLLHYANSQDGFSPDYPRARAAYDKAIAAGDVPSLLSVGMMYTYGRGVPKDAAKAREFKQRAAEAGSRAAQKSLGRDFFEAKDFKNAVLWFQKAVDAGEEQTLGELATALEKAGDAVRAIPAYQKHLALHTEDFQLWYALGALQETQRDFPGALASYRKVAAINSPYNTYKDLAQSRAQWVQEEINPAPGSIVALRQQAEKGDVEAMFKLVQQLGPTDKPAALEWLKKAAAKEHPRAMLLLGLETAATDKVAALALIQKAAVAGSLDAKFRLGVMQTQGREMPLDQAKGLALVIEAADGGFAPAQMEYGRVLVTGSSEIPAAPTRGLDYLRKAAAQNLPQAAALLGEAAERGIGGPVDLKQALKWYQQAVRGGLQQVVASEQRVQRQLDDASKR